MCWAGDLVYWLCVAIHFQEVVGSNLSTRYWMDIFLHNVEICLTFVWKRPEKQKEVVNGPLKSIRVVSFVFVQYWLNFCKKNVKVYMWKVTTKIFLKTRINVKSLWNRERNRWIRWCEQWLDNSGYNHKCHSINLIIVGTIISSYDKNDHGHHKCI